MESRTDLAKAERFLSRFQIRSRDSHKQVPFILNYNQKKIHAVAAKQQARDQPIRIVVDKARRVGVSSWAEGLGFAHCCSMPSSHFLIAAHEFKSSKALFSIPKSFAKQARFLNLRDVEREITFPHEIADGLMQIVTAGKDTSGRGFTLSGLHLSECAHYKGGGDIFTSVLPAVSNHRDTIVIIESTPNGMDGEGAQFYEMWMDAVEERSEYEAVFLSWIDDPGCVADPEIAKNAPIDKEEKELLKRGLSKAQLAFRRQKISSPECGGLVDLFHQEYPSSWQESFITSGFPAFNEVERLWASKNIRDPKWIGFIEHTDDGTLKLREHHKGEYAIWEDLKPGHYYYLGADAARGDDQDKTKDRDFAANVVLDGNTGRQVARYAGFVVPEVHGCYINSIGRHYNRAMVNGELTGGYGYGTLYVLRDILKYPNLYRWKGKDDKIGSWASGKNAVWIETTQHIRTMLFESMRAALREGAGTEGEFGVTIYDDMLASQIRMCTRKETGRVDVKKGHDDVLFSCCAEGTNVETTDGFRQIQFVQPRESLSTHLGNLLAIRTKSQREVDEDIIQIKALGSHRLLRLTKEHPVYISRYEWRKRRTKTRKKILVVGPHWKEAKDIRTGDYLFLPKRKGLSQCTFTNEQLYVMGWYMAEGCVCGKQTISFALHAKEIEVAKRLSRIMMEYDPPTPTYGGYGNRAYNRIAPTFKQSKGDGWVLRYTSPYWASLLSYHCGNLAEHKSLSRELYQSSGLLPLVRSYIDGDGCRTTSCQRDHLFVTSKSEKLIHQIRQVLIDHGIWCTVSRPNSQDICSLHMTPEYFSILGSDMNKHREVQRIFEKRYVVETEDGFWTTVKDVKTVHYSGAVYNFAVTEDESYVAEGYAIHNCMIANLAMRQYAPPRTLNPVRSKEAEEDEEVRNKMGLRGDAIQDDACFALINHHKKIMQKVERFPNEDEYEEAYIGGS